jgi:signal transduction histidine kinase
LALLALLLGLAGNAFCQPSAESLQRTYDNGDPHSVIQAFEKINLNALEACKRPAYQLIAGHAYNAQNEDSKAFKLFLAAKEGFKKCGDIDKAMEINLTLAYKSQFTDENPYLEEYVAYAEKSKRPELMYRALFMTMTVNIDYEEHDQKEKPKTKKALESFWRAKSLEKLIDEKSKKRAFRENIGVLYSEILQNYDSARYYLEESYRLLSGPVTEYHVYNLVNQASVYNHMMELDKSIEKLKEADRLPMKTFRKRTKMSLYDNLRNVYERKNAFDSAYKYQRLSEVYRDSINEEEKERDIRQLETRYKTKQRELENVTLKSQLQRNRTIIAVIAGILLASLIISYLINKNAVRKKTIAEQQRLLETHKLETQLREQQLHEIDRMLETQEKERKRIANELHDDLGSMLATLKLNVDNMAQADDRKQIGEKTKELIEEAYSKVRNLSHLKNLGVVGSQGLLIAVEKMAEKMTILNKLEVKVYPYGLEQRLDNQLEVTLFRMIQELCTNALKHARATHINIYLTQHQHQLNIMIEDDGIGFDPSTLTGADGMGLRNIEKKTEQLGGTFTLDTKPGKGTTIIIDLPL